MTLKKYYYLNKCKKNKSSTKPKGATGFKETKFDIIPRAKLVKLEAEGGKD